MPSRNFKLLLSVGETVKRLLCLSRAQQPQSPTPSPSPFTVVPFDVAEEILFYLSCQEILRMKQV